MLPIASGAIVRFHYKNWQGKEGMRTVLALYVWRGATKWHPDDQWFLHVYDQDIGKVREFAMIDMTNISLA